MKNKKIQLLIRSIPVLLLMPFASQGQGIEIPSGGNITATGAATIEINNGGFINNGTYTKGTETFTMSGATPGTISGTALSDFNNLSITNSAGISIADNSKVTVSGTLSVTTMLTLNSTANGTASLIQSTAGVTATVQRYIAAADWGTWNDGWHFLSSPVANQAISTNFTVNPDTEYDFYCWYEPTNEWVNFKNTAGTAPIWSTGNTINNGLSNNADNFLAGKGYMTAYKTAGTKSFSGSLNVSDLTVSSLTVTGSTQTNRSWHLLGNPFTSALAWYTDWTTSNIGGVTNIWNEISKSYSPINAGEIIPAGNGFMVQADLTGASLTIPAAKRVHSAQAWYKNSVDPVLQLFAHDLDNASFQESQVRINPESTTRFDFEFDGNFLPGYAPMFYSVMEGENLMVNSIPELNSETVIPFHFIKNEGTNFTIEAKGIESLGTSDIVYLKDKKLGTDFNLSENNVYSFTSFAGDDAARFELHFRNFTGIKETQPSKDFNIYASEGMVNIQSLQQLSAKVVITDMIGRTIATGRVEAGAAARIHIQGNSGVYIVSMITNKGKTNTKIVVR